MADKPFWHHIKGKLIELWLYLTSRSVKLNQPAPLDLPIWRLSGEKDTLRAIVTPHLNDSKYVIINMGSFTCPVWRERQTKVIKLANQYKDQLVCLTIYVREAHANNEWALDMNEKADISYPKPQTIDERILIAERAKKTLMCEQDKMYVDGVKDNAINKAYRAVPIRLCVIAPNGNLIYRSKGTGPFGFKPEELADFLTQTVGAI